MHLRVAHLRTTSATNVKKAHQPLNGTKLLMAKVLTSIV